MLIAKEISKSYNQLPLIQDLEISIAPGEIVAIVGASGAGKTTLLHLLSTLDYPDSGSITLDGIDLSTLKGKRLAEFRNKKIGFVFQLHNLLPEFTLFENICLPGYISKKPKKAVAQKGSELVELLGLDAVKDHFPANSSGGELQRTAVARALINSPAIVFADEPSGSLDEKNATILYALFLELSKLLAQTFVLVTHSPGLTTIANRVLLLKNGKLQHME